MRRIATVENLVAAKASDFNKAQQAAANDSTAVTWGRQESIDFNQCQHPVRDPGVEGSSAFARTVILNNLEC
jgi:hypothetical protein